MYLKLGFVNILTLIRIIGTIILIPLYNTYGGKIAGIVSLICYLTDSIDGILARKWKVSTFFGAIFDGVADKLFTITNFIILYLITPYALIPIIIEILIVIINMFKFNRNLNIQANMIGKCKTWFLAIGVVLTFFASDISNLKFLSLSFKNWVLSISDSTLYLCLLAPAIIMVTLTLFSYIFDLLNPNSIKNITQKQKKIKKVKLNYEERKNYIKNVWLSPEFYENHKDDANLRDLGKLSRK